MLFFEKIGVPTVVLSVLLALFAGCSDSEDSGSGDSTSEARIAAETVKWYETTNSIEVLGAGGLTYRADIELADGESWCSFKSLSAGAAPVLEKSGPVGQAPIYLYMSENRTEADRTATVRIVYSNGNADVYETSLHFTQSRYTETASYDRAWGEQPAFYSSSDYIYKTYYVTLGGSKRRNYSICFDRTKHVSAWVAYPVHAFYSTYSGYQNKNGNGRTDAWAYDDTRTEYQSQSPYYKSLGRTITQPEIAESLQQYVLRSYGAGGLNRGHMLASATRLASWDANAQTFYATNMMPQNGTVNSGKWAALESSERQWAGSGRNDTLWVVTGASFKDSETISNNGNRVAVPSHCWKVMLRIRSGAGSKQLADCTAGELKAIGFIYENETAGNSVSLREASCSVSEVEEFTGFEFFRNLPEAIAAEVKRQHNPSDWSGL